MTHPCTSPELHVHDAAGFVAAVERACSDRGLRLTAIRARVLGLIAQAGPPIKAYDLLDKVRDGEGVGAAAPPTVYRALDFLLANGFIPAYPNAFFVVEAAKLSAFVDAVARLGSESDYSALMASYGIRRTDPRFWPHSDALHLAWRQSEPREAGLFDYNRFENR